MVESNHVFYDAKNFLLFQTWFLNFCIVELLIYMCSSMYVCCKLRGILKYRNYLIIIAFIVSLGANIVLIKYSESDVEKYEFLTKGISTTDGDNDSK